MQWFIQANQKTTPSPLLICHPVCTRSILSKESHRKHRWGLESKMWGLWVKKKKKIIWSYLLLLILVYSLYPPNQMVQWPWVDMLSSLECPPYLLQVFWWPQTYQSAKTLIQLGNKRCNNICQLSMFQMVQWPWVDTLSSLGCPPYFRCLGDLIHTAVLKPWSSYGIEGVTIYLNYISEGTVTLSGQIFFSGVSSISSSGVLVTSNTPECQNLDPATE